MSRALRPVLSPERREALMREGLALLHAGSFFAAHERFEEIWRSTTPEPRDLFQGLVQLAAAFHHLHARQRPDVAARVLAKARRRLAPLAPAAAGVDVAGLLAQLEAWRAWLPQASGPAPPPLRIGWRESAD